MCRGIVLSTLLLLIPYSNTLGQEEEKNADSNPPAILTTRAEEDYSSLKDNDSTDFFLRDLKYIPITNSKKSFLTIGGEYRARLDQTINRSFTDEDNTSYLQRLNLHVAINFGKRVKLFTELYHGLSSAGDVALQSDDIDFHQAFIMGKIIDKENHAVQIRVGRQEMGYGSSRLVGIRNGPNMRRSFDMAKLSARLQQIKLDVFYGEEVAIATGAFDNKLTLFNSNSSNPNLWGVYLSQPLYQDERMLELYYMGFHSNFSAFSDVAGEELRHSFGIRSFGSFGSFGKFTYNSEFIFQLGDLDGSNISAFNLEADWNYRLSDSGWRPKVGLKFDWSSGDKTPGDGRVGTFNPMFVNPGIYSLASVNTPANLTSLHPNLTVFPIEKLSLYLDYAFFFRTQSTDGFYSPPRFLSRPASINSTKYLGHTFGILMNYEINRNLSFDVVSYYFITGDFIEDTGDAENIFFLAPTLSCKF